MAVVDYEEIWKGRGGELKQDEGSVVRVFRVWTNNPADDARVIVNFFAGATPPIYPGRPHPDDSSAFCIGVNPQNVLGPLGWVVTVSYSNRRELAQDPVDDPVSVEWLEEDFDKNADRDRNGDAILNSAKQPPNPPVVVPDSYVIAEVSANAPLSPAWLRACRKSINTVPFVIDGQTVSERRGRVKSIRLGRRKWRGAYEYREAKINLAILEEDDDDWLIRWLDAGFEELVDDELKRIVLDDGSDPTEPQPLDGAGVRLLAPTPSTVIWNETEWFKEIDFIGLIPGCTAVPV